jgi:hypothetical protein
MNEALAVFARAIERIAMDTGAAVVIVRHVSKQAAREQVVDSYAGRGGGALSDAARSVLVMTRDRKPEEDDDGEPDPLASVRLTHAKSTHAPQGPRLVWKPVATEHGVYLAPLSQVEEDRAGARRLLAFLRERGAEGVAASELHKDPPPGLTRRGAKAAIEHLLRSGEAIPSEEVRGRNRQPTTIYRAREAT